MFLLARTMPARRAHWRGAALPRPLEDTASTMFAGAERSVIVDALQADGLFSGLALPLPVHEEILRFARATRCSGIRSRIEFLPSDHTEAERRFDRSVLSGHYFERILQCDRGH